VFNILFYIEAEIYSSKVRLGKKPKFSQSYLFGMALIMKMFFDPVDVRLFSIVGLMLSSEASRT
jgi:hypothetical protein